jgi:GTP-binding protein HflX
LPTQLVAAFRATLEEVLLADVILHVRDIAHPSSEAQRDDVVTLLKELGIGNYVANGIAQDGASDAPAPIIEVWNKIDLLDTDQRKEIESKAATRETASLFRPRQVRALMHSCILWRLNWFCKTKRGR